MSQFRRLLDRGLAELARVLSETVGQGAAETITRLVGDLNFPGLIGLLGTSETAAMPDRVGIETDLRDAILERAVEKLAEEAGVSVTPEQVREAAALLATGEFFRDVGDATAAVLFLVRGLPLALRRDMRGPLRISRVLVAIVRDVGGGVSAVPSIYRDLRDGKLDDPPVVLGHTLGALYGFASLRSTVETIQELLDPENESVRLAILVYARANGIPLEAADLDVVRETVFAPDDPDLGPALVRALERLARDRDLGAIEEMLSGMPRLS